MTYFVDIDNTICYTNGTEYAYADAKKFNISRINKLYDEGHAIVYWTARGSGTGIDWRQVTEDQLSGWGARYTELRFGKPAFDKFIDDKAIASDDFFREQVRLYKKEKDE